MNQSSEGRFSDPRDELDCFHGLKASNDSREHAQNAGLRSCGDSSFRRRFGKEATVAGTSKVRCEDRDLAFELKDGSVDQGFLLEKGCVVGTEAGWKVVRAIKDEIVAGKELEAVLRFESPGCSTISTCGLTLASRSCALAIFGVSARSVSWTICLCRLESSTLSGSIRPILPIPAAAR